MPLLPTRRCGALQSAGQRSVQGISSAPTGGCSACQLVSAQHKAQANRACRQGCELWKAEEDRKLGAWVDEAARQKARSTATVLRLGKETAALREAQAAQAAHRSDTGLGCCCLHATLCGGG